MLVRPTILPLESREGFQLRAASANGLRRPGWLAGAVTAEQAAFRAAPAPWRTTRFARFCPLCLGEDALWQESWTFAAVPVCLRHAVELSDRCHECKQPLTWSRARLEHCVCGARLAEQPVRQLREPSAQLAAMLGSIEVARAPGRNDFSTLTLAEAGRLIVAVGASLVWPSASRPVRELQRSCLQDCLKVFHASAGVLVDWPTNFVRHLTGLMHRALDDGRRGPSVVFRRLRGALTLEGQDGGLAFVKEELDAFLAQNWPFGLDHRNGLTDVGLAKHLGYLPLAAAARLLAMRPGRLLTLAARHGVQLTQVLSDQGRRFLFVASADLSALREFVADEVSLKHAARMLGVSRSRIIELARGNLVTGWRGGSPKRMVAISRRSVEQLRAQVLARSDLWGGRDAEAVRLCEVLRLRVPIEESARFFETLLAGHIAVWRTDDRGHLGHLALSVADLSREQTAGAAEVLTVRQAALRMGVKEQVLYRLVRHRLIPARRDRGAHRRQALVRTRDIDAFESDYVSAKELAHMHQTSSSAAVRCLARAGVRPVTGPTVDGSRQYFFAKYAGLQSKLKANRPK